MSARRSPCVANQLCVSTPTGKNTTGVPARAKRQMDVRRFQKNNTKKHPRCFAKISPCMRCYTVPNRRRKASAKRHPSQCTCTAHLQFAWQGSFYPPLPSPPSKTAASQTNQPIQAKGKFSCSYYRHAHRTSPRLSVVCSATVLHMRTSPVSAVSQCSRKSKGTQFLSTNQ